MPGGNGRTGRKRRVGPNLGPPKVLGVRPLGEDAGFSAAYDCDNETPHDITYVNFRVYERYGLSALVHAVLIGVGVSAVLDATDRIAAPANCMRADGIVSNCVFADGVTIAAAYQRCSTGTQDQLVMLQDAYGC
jgi:hypothetical protein